MDLERINVQPASHVKKNYRNLSILSRAGLAAVAIAGFITLGVFYTSGVALFAADSGDSVSQSDQKSRIEAFEAIKYLMVSTVSAAEIPAAIDSMHLTPDEQSKLRVELAQSSTTPPTHEAHSDVLPARNSRDNADTSAAHAAVDPAPQAPAQAALRVAVSTDKAAGGALVWVRLWDSDVEDGDVVRIESAGYSRTVTLTKRGNTFAVPVSTSGQLRITGVRDGDGGGITVGLGSGSAQAILPIMSVGQVLTLNVRTN